MLDELLIKKYDLKNRLAILYSEWKELEDDLRWLKMDYENLEEELERVEQEIKEEM